MNFRDELARIIANDPRYSIEAYAFVLEALNHAKHQKLKAHAHRQDADRSSDPQRKRRRPSSSKKRVSGHVTGGKLCEALRKLALRQYGLLSATVLNHWGIHSTSDVGEIVYNLIAADALKKTASDSRSDFDNVFDFDKELRPALQPPAGSVGRVEPA